uniref:Uncharacterized protein n=1 Tax=Terrapene triunguis TaxID=2587831 RepID=A0A674IDL5_9SAUR
MHDHQQGGAGDQDELQGPEADVGDGEEVVEADIGAAGLARVAVEVLVVIAPHSLSRHHVDQHPEDEDQGEPDAPEGRGVFVHPTQEPFEDTPVHGLWLPLIGSARGRNKETLINIPGSGSKHTPLPELGREPRSPASQCCPYCSNHLFLLPLRDGNATQVS